MMSSSYYPTAEPCQICGATPAGIEPRYSYVVCALHARLSPVECWGRIAARRVELGITPAPTVVASRDALATILADVLRGTLHCTRSWQAWGVGTMSEHDFKPVETSDTPFECADAVIAFFAASQESRSDGQNRTVGLGQTSSLPEPLASELQDWWDNGGDDKEPLDALIARGLQVAASGGAIPDPRVECGESCDAQTVHCPACGAEPGQSCSSEQGVEWGRAVHASRQSKWVEEG